MDQAIKEQWIAALRSGEYKQGTGCLKNTTEENSSYCCLGVLCDLYAKEHNQEWEVGTNPDTGKKCNFFLGADELLPVGVTLWAGLTSRSPEIVQKKYSPWINTLAQYNDSGSDFNEIADIIEEQL